MSQRLLSSFHPTNGSFAIVSHDQRLKVFNVLTQQLQQDLTEQSHLSQIITCIAYPSSGSKGASTHSIAVGTKTGEILIWNTRKGEVEHRLGQGADKHQSSVTSLVFHPSGTFLFSSSTDKTVKQWNIASGSVVAQFTTQDADEQPSFTRVAASPDGTHVAAGGVGVLALWNLANPSAPVREYQGPTERISALAFSPDGKFIATGSANERYVTIWSAEVEGEEDGAGGKKKKKHSTPSTKGRNTNTPVHTITLTTTPISIQFNPTFHQPKGTYQIGIVADSSIVSVVQWSSSQSHSSSSSPAHTPFSSSSSTATAPQSTITIPNATAQSEAAKRRDAAYNALDKKNKLKANSASSTLLSSGDLGDSVGQGVILALTFDSSSKLTLARGDAVRPAFETVEFKTGEAFESSITLGKFNTQNLLAGSQTATQAHQDKKRKAVVSQLSNEAVTLGALHTRDTVQTASSGLDGEPAQKKQKLAPAKSKSDALSRSLAERLQEAEQQSLTAGFDLSTGELPKAGSLQTILQQALHSNDLALVEYCLTAGAQGLASNSNLIRLTVKRLSPTYVLPLLNHLMSKFASRPNRSAQLLPWLREIFKTHTAFLIRQPQLTHKLSPLYHLLDTRLSVFKKLLKLQGRLELLLSQISTAKHPGQDAADEEEAMSSGPQNTFNDLGDDDDDREDERMSGEEDDEDQMDGGDDDDEEMHDEEEEEEDGEEDEEGEEEEEEDEE